MGDQIDKYEQLTLPCEKCGDLTDNFVEWGSKIRQLCPPCMPAAYEEWKLTKEETYPMSFRTFFNRWFRRESGKFEKNKDTSSLARQLASTCLVAPREMGGEIVAEGDSGHVHRFDRTGWDRFRLGHNVVDCDGYMATYKYLYRCVCGREMVTATRAMI